MTQFEQLLGYEFKNSDLLHEALSHSSYANENKKHRNSNERLEFLGDSVLSIVVSEYLFSNYKNLPEGELTKIRASLVCESSLFEFAQRIKLGEFILLGKGEENTGGRDRRSILADAFEAFCNEVQLQGFLPGALQVEAAVAPLELAAQQLLNLFHHIAQGLGQGGAGFGFQRAAELPAGRIKQLRVAFAGLHVAGVDGKHLARREKNGIAAQVALRHGADAQPFFLAVGLEMKG